MTERDLDRELLKRIDKTISDTAARQVGRTEPDPTYRLESALHANIERLDRSIARIASLKGPRHLAGALLRRSVVRDTQYDKQLGGDTEIRSPLFGITKEMLEGHIVQRGWQLRYTYYRRYDGWFREKVYPFSDTRIDRVMQTTGAERHNVRRTWYSINTFDGEHRRVVSSKPAAQDKDLAIMLAITKATGYRYENSLMADYLEHDYDWDDTDDYYPAPYPEVDWFLPTASPRAVEHCYALSTLALKEFGL